MEDNSNHNLHFLPQQTPQQLNVRRTQQQIYLQHCHQASCTNFVQQGLPPQYQEVLFWFSKKLNEDLTISTWKKIVSDLGLQVPPLEEEP